MILSQERKLVNEVPPAGSDAFSLAISHVQLLQETDNFVEGEVQ